MVSSNCLNCAREGGKRGEIEVSEDEVGGGRSGKPELSWLE